MKDGKSKKEKLKREIPSCLGQSSVNYNAWQRSKVARIWRQTGSTVKSNIIVRYINGRTGTRLCLKDNPFFPHGTLI